MLQVAWNLRELIEEFLDLYEDAEVANDRLDDIEWSIIRTIKEFLEELSMSTKACESRNSTLDLTLPCTDYILAQFENGQSQYKDEPIFGPMFRSGWKKMNKYYNLFDKTPAYAAALVYTLHASGGILRGIGRRIGCYLQKQLSRSSGRRNTSL